jgi:hypothetical protein
MNVAAYFAPADCVCPCCLVEFSNRTILIQHMSRGSGTCLVNTLLRHKPLKHCELREVQQCERIAQARRERAGLPRFKAESPPVRHCGPLLPIASLKGDILSTKSNLHPFGPQKRKYIYAIDEDTDVI